MRCGRSIDLPGFRQDPVPDTVSGIVVGEVGGIRPPEYTLGTEPRLDLFPADIQQRTDDHTLTGAHTLHPRQMGAAKQMQQQCLCLIFPVMGHGDLRAAPFLPHPGKGLITGFAARLLQREPFPPGHSGHITVYFPKRNATRFTQLTAKGRIFQRLLPPDAMLYMYRTERQRHFPGNHLQNQQQADRIRTTRQPHHDAIPR